MSSPTVLVVHNDDSDPVARLGEWLADAGLELRVVHGAELPADLSGYHGLVVLGGAMGANDDADVPWLAHVRTLLREAVAAELPTLAICLGAQLLAVANGGRVEPNPDGPEIGAQLIAKRAAASTDPLFGPMPITPDVLQWHYDAVSVLPPGAILLASSPLCENQAFRLGRLAWGVQFHIETTPEIVREWAAEDAGILDGFDLELIVSRSDGAHDDIAEAWAPFAHAFAAVVRDPAAVPAARGVPTSTAAPVTDPAAIRAALAAEANAARASLPMPTLRPPRMAEPPGQGRVAVQLARFSFADGARAARVLAGVGWWDETDSVPASDAAAVVVAALGRSADPDAALDALSDIIAAPAGADLRAAIEQHSDLRARLAALLGVSYELAGHLRAHPRDWEVLLGDLDVEGIPARLAAAVGADAAAPVTGTGGVRADVTGPSAIIALRAAYRRELVAIAGRDLAGDLDLRVVTELLADLAGHMLQAALAVAAAGLPDDAAPCRLAIIAMGKTGSRELNYVSDVDVVFVAEPVDPEAGPEPALATATRLAGETMRLCRAAAWEVDANLRPEGKDGPLVRTLASHEAYYQRWASTWEFQALLKARAIAGDIDLGRAYRDVIAPLVWTAAERPGFVADVRAMRRRVVDHIPATLAERDIKLGRGGLRDVEFAVQLLQLVHGRGDETLRVPETLPALDALRNGGYVGRDDAVSLIDAYRFLRATEHRLQLRRLRRTHVLPDSASQLAWLGRAMGYRPDHRGDARAVFESEWNLHAREVRRLHEKLFYRPLLEAVARVPSAGLRLTPTEAGRRLAALGFADPAAALRHIESLTAGLSRRAALQRALLPVLLSDFADAPDPDAGLLAYRRLSDELGSTPWYLRLLRDGDTVASRLAYVLGTSRYVARMLGRAPEALQLLASSDQLRPRDPAELSAAMQESAARHEEPDAAVAAARGQRRQELLRTAFADLLHVSDVVEVCGALSATTEATLDVALTVASRTVAEGRGLAGLPIRFSVIAMGRLGGAEIGYGSDADVMFVYEDGDADSETAAKLAQEVAGQLRALLAAPSSPDPPLAVDAGLRPEGRDGPLARSLASYERYYARWSSAWEAQALLRARPVAGDADLGRRFVAMIDPVRYPDAGVSAGDLMEIRRLKGRIDSERLPRGADPTTHTKLGRGGLTDIEWTIQLLQLGHGHAVPGLRTTRTLDALSAAADAGLLGAERAVTLATAWRFATRVRNALMLVRDKPSDQVPSLGTELVAVGRVLGYRPGSDPGQLVDDYRRAARRARRVVEAVFYGP